jgi:hypothetical protein
VTVSIADVSFVWPASRLAGTVGLATATRCGTILDCVGEDVVGMASALRHAGITEVLLRPRQVRRRRAARLDRLPAFGRS